MTTTKSICTITTIYSTQLQPYAHVWACALLVQSDTTHMQTAIKESDLTIHLVCE